METGRQIMFKKLTGEQLRKAIDTSKGKKLTKEQRIKFSKIYTKKINKCLN